MRKHIFITVLLLIFAANLTGWSMFALAADEVSFAHETPVVVSGSGITFYVEQGSVVDEMVVYSTYVTFTLSANSKLELRSYNRELFTNSLANTDCSNNSYSKLVISAQATQTTTTVTPTSNHTNYQ